MQFLKITVITILISTIFSAAVVSAHGDGSSWEVPAGKYIADVGYEPDEFVAGQPVRFDLNLTQSAGDTSTAVPFAEVWVRMKSTDTTYLATGVRKQTIGPTTLLYTFAAPGSYSLEASFRDTNGNEIASASFPVSVAASPDAASTQGVGTSMGLVLGGVALGVVLAILFSAIRKLRKS